MPYHRYHTSSIVHFCSIFSDCVCTTTATGERNNGFSDLHQILSSNRGGNHSCERDVFKPTTVVHMQQVYLWNMIFERVYLHGSNETLPLDAAHIVLRRNGDATSVRSGRVECIDPISCRYFQGNSSFFSSSSALAVVLETSTRTRFCVLTRLASTPDFNKASDSILKAGH